MDIQNLRDEYIELAIAWGTALSQGDSKITNKLHRKLSKFVLKIEKDRVLSEKIFSPLLDHKDLSVKLWTIIEAFRLGINVDKAEQLLQTIVNDPFVGPPTGGVKSMAYIIQVEWKKDKSERKIYLGEKCEKVKTLPSSSKMLPAPSGSLLRCSITFPF